MALSAVEYPTLGATCPRTSLTWYLGNLLGTGGTDGDDETKALESPGDGDSRCLSHLSGHCSSLRRRVERELEKEVPVFSRADIYSWEEVLAARVLLASRD